MFSVTIAATHNINLPSYVLYMPAHLRYKEMLTLSEVQALADRCVITAALD